MIGITAYGAYIPLRRLQRKAIHAANSWFAPGLKGAGERAMASWDEDAISMGVEAARNCLPVQNDVLQERASLDALYFASTSMPFLDRQNAGVIAAALNLPQQAMTLDIAGSQRAGLSALLSALDAVQAGRLSAPVLVAAEKRRARAASSEEMRYGDGAAALALGCEHVIARFIASHTLSMDFIDHFRSQEAEFDYGWEERWIRDEGFSKILPAAIKALLDKTEIAPDQINHIILPCPYAKLDQQIAKKSGLDPACLCDNLNSQIGDTGVAHPLILLAHVLEKAQPGDKILIAQFGQGCETALFEVTDHITRISPRAKVSKALARKKDETNYLKYLAFNGLIELEKGMRAEIDKRTAHSVLYRKNDMILGLVGGKCQSCGTPQFPRSRLCVNPDCGAQDSQIPHGFSESAGNVLSWSADHLTFSMNPPNHYGMITFQDGGRLMADISDVDAGEVQSGMTVRMSFRIKDFDDKRGFRRYFWKAVPA